MKEIIKLIQILIFISIFIYCKEDLEVYKTPDDFIINLEITKIDNINLNAVVQSEGNFKILEGGFLINEQPFNCDEEVLVKKANFSNNTLSVENIDWSTNTPLYVRAFLVVKNTASDKTRRVCSELKQSKTDELNLVGSSEFIERNKIQLNGRLIGIDRDVSAQDHGFFWFGPVAKTINQPDLEEVFNTANSEKKISLGTISDTNSVFSYIPNFQKGQYYYFSPYTIYEDEILFNEDGKFEEVFIGDFWEFKQGDDYVQSPGYLRDAIGFSIKGKGYVTTGAKGDGTLSNELWEYTPDSDTWKQLPNFPGKPRRLAAGFVLQDKIYVGTGTGYRNIDIGSGGCVISDSLLYGDFYEYDPILNEWTRKANFPTNRVGAAAFAINDKGYMGTGYYFEPSLNESGNSRALYEYCPELNDWKRMENLNTRYGRRRSVGFAIEDKGYIIAGITCCFFSRGLYRFDRQGGELGNWYESFAFDGGRRYAAIGFTIGDKGYIGGGSQTDGCGDVFPSYTSLWMYDSPTESWTQKADIEVFPIQGAATFVIGNKAYLWGGNIVSDKQAITNDLRVYTPDKGVFEQR